MYSGAAAQALHSAKKERDREKAKTLAASVKPATEPVKPIIQKVNSSSFIKGELALAPKKDPAIKPGKIEQAPLVTTPELNDETRRQMNIAAMKLAREANYQVYNLVDSSIIKTDSNNNNANVEEFFDFLVFGCHGTPDGIFQQQVADLAARLIQDPENRPKFVLVLGDNFYPNGVQSPDDDKFQKRFYAIYQELAKYNIPCFPVLGNHCENLHKIAVTGEKGVDVGLRQVAHFYLGEPSRTYATPEGEKVLYPTPDEKEKLAKKGHQIDDHVVGKNAESINLDLKQLPPWCMFGRSNALNYANTEFFLIDSNTYVSDYLKYLILKNEIAEFEKQITTEKSPALRNKKTLEIAKRQAQLQKNQVARTVEEFQKAKAAGKRTILVGHHPPKTVGKRAYEPDVTLKGEITGTPIYFNEEEEKLIRAHFGEIPKEKSYNWLFKRCLQEQREKGEFACDTILAAHDHAMYYYDNSNKQTKFPVCEVVSGGGGGHLQHRLYFGSQENLGGYFENYGLVRVRCSTTDPKNTEYWYYCLENSKDKTKKLDFEAEVHFKQGSTTPLRNFDNISQDEQAKINQLCSAVSKAIDNYFKLFINPRQNEHKGAFFSPTKNLTHTYDDIKNLHKAWTNISKFKADNYKITLEMLNKLLPKKVSEHSFSTYLNKAIKDTYQNSFATFDDLYQKEMQSYKNSLVEMHA